MTPMPDLAAPPIQIVQHRRERFGIDLCRVSNRKSKRMQNQSISVFSVRSTLGKMETTPQIGDTFEKVSKTQY